MAQTQVDLHQHQFVQLMVLKIQELGAWKEGTYNPHDPTAYVRGEAKLHREYGYQVTPCGYPIEETIEAQFIDNTWGVEFIFHTSIGMVDGYFDRGTKEWARCHPRFFEIFKDVLMTGSESMAELRRGE